MEYIGYAFPGPRFSPMSESEKADLRLSCLRLVLDQYRLDPTNIRSDRIDLAIDRVLLTAERYHNYVSGGEARPSVSSPIPA